MQVKDIKSTKVLKFENSVLRDIIYKYPQYILYILSLLCELQKYLSHHHYDKRDRKENLNDVIANERHRVVRINRALINND